uniref:BACK domain-containing protein n=1 Tax=Glossina austeni TaxID=7395 RepID=A0A1A9VGK0_GLOAU
MDMPGYAICVLKTFICIIACMRSCKGLSGQQHKLLPLGISGGMTTTVTMINELIFYMLLLGSKVMPIDVSPLPHSETYSNSSYSRAGLDVLNKQRQEGKNLTETIFRFRSFVILFWKRRLKMIITDDNLYVRGEDIAYHGLLKWIKHDPESRRVHLYELMSQIDLPRVRRRLVLLKGIPRYGSPHVLFAGGKYENKQLFPCKLRNIFFDEELTIGPMREHRNHLSVASLNGFVYCTGAVSGSLLLRSAEYYDPIVNEWNLIAPMRESHHSHGSCVFDNHIYVIGGYMNSTVENYNPKTDKWYRCPNTPSQYSTGNRAAVIENSIYSLGDYESVTLNNRFDPREGRWQRLSGAPYLWRDTEVASYGQSLYCIGGDFDSHQCTRYDVRSDRWETLSSMMSGRCGHSVVIYKNKIYVFGGYDERYYIRINEWKRLGIDSIDRQYDGASLLYTNLDNMKNFLCL